MNINNITTKLNWTDSTARFRDETNIVVLYDIAAVSSSSITNVGIAQTLSTLMHNFCTEFVPILPQQGLSDTTVVENTYMTYSLPAYCDSTDNNLTYTLTFANGSAIPSWIIWDGASRTL